MIVTILSFNLVLSCSLYLLNCVDASRKVDVINNNKSDSSNLICRL